MIYKEIKDYRKSPKEKESGRELEFTRLAARAVFQVLPPAQRWPRDVSCGHRNPNSSLRNNVWGRVI